LRQGREHLITSLGLRMVHLATTDGPHSFSALAFLLRTWGGSQWRVPKGEEEEQAAAAAASAANDTPTVIILPHNGRDAIPEHMQPPRGLTPARREIEIEGTAEPTPSETTEPRQEQWIKVKVRR
jgi:hypothetical protein